MTRETVALLLVGLLAACKSGSSTAPEPISHEQFCERLATILCAASERCCTEEGGSEESAACTALRESVCDEWRYVLADEGFIGANGEQPENQIEHLRYRGDHAAAYLQQLERKAERCDPIAALPLASRKRSEPALFVSNLGESDSCLLSAGCAEGLVCRAGDDDDLICRPPAAAGERCGGDLETCAEGLECSGEDFESERCAPALLGDQGERCSSARDCKSGYCARTSGDDDFCAACSDHADCPLGMACDDGACERTAKLERREDGARCRAHGECTSRDCWQGRCVEADANHFYCINPLDRLFPGASS
jgi:hypothetical protein